MRLVLFTAHYPFGSGEEFLEDELRVAEEYFEKIIIVTTEKNPVSMTRYIPENTEIIPVRRNVRQSKRVLECTLCLFQPRVWREFFHAKRTTAYSAVTILKGILIEENALGYIRRHQREWSGDGADTVYYSYWLRAEFAMNDPRLKGLKISRAHGGDCFFSRGYHPYRKEALQNLDFVFPVSQAGRNDIIDHYEGEVAGLEQKVRAARLGIRIPDALNPSPDKRVKTIVTCSNIIRLKRLDLMIDALSEISDMDIHWIHFGEGELKKTILRYAGEKLGGRKNISFEFKGYTPNSELMQFYTEHPVDLFVNCSDVEGIPVSVMEAMAYGIPAIGRNMGGMQELVDESCGILLPGMIEAHDLALAITEILNLPRELYFSMRKSARSKVGNLYNEKKNYRLFYENIKECLNSNE